MYRKQKKIPTLLALFLLFSAVGLTVYVDGSYQKLTTKAEDILAPTDVHISNITDNSLTVSFLTEKAVITSVSVSGEGIKSSFLDDLDNDGKPRPRLTHIFTVKNLKVDREYKIRLFSGGQKCLYQEKCPEYIQKTGVFLPGTLELPPVKGQILDQSEKPLENAMVYLLIGQASPLLGRSDRLGKWVIPLNNLRTQDFLSRPHLTVSSRVQLTVKINTSEYSSAVADIAAIKTGTLPSMQIGKRYNFLNTADDSQPQTVLGQQKEIKSGAQIPENGVGFLFPKFEMDATSDRLPNLRGVGIAGEKLKITVKSTPQSATVIVAADGSWIFRPKKTLDPGIHEVVIESTDKYGRKVILSRQFAVLKSGEAVLGDATPSASLTPTATPSAEISITPTSEPTLTPTPTETPTPTPQPPTPTQTIGEIEAPPRSGTTGITGILLGTSVTLLLLGAGILIKVL